MVDDRSRVHIVWPTLVPGATPESEPTLALFYASSKDGVRFTPRQPLPTESFPRHPQVALSASGELTVVWDEQAVAGSRRIAWALGTVDGNGTARFTRHLVDGGDAGSYPVVAATPDGPVVAWTGGPAGQTVLRVAHLDGPQHATR